MVNRVPLGILHLRTVALVAVVALASSCGDSTDPSRNPASVSVSPAAWLLYAVPATTHFNATVRDAAGEELASAVVEWSSSDPAVATIDPSRGLATAVAPGVATIRATAGASSGSAILEVYLDPNHAPFAAGSIYYGRNEYVEYIAGDLPVILSAPHGGYAEPDEIADRTYGVTSQDRNTQELARALAARILQQTGHHPHVVISRIHRIKLDPNREIFEASQGDPFSKRAWKDYHGFIEQASLAVDVEFGGGIYLDLHGHGHEIQRLELGYLLSSADLELADAQLDDSAIAESSSIRDLVTRADTGFVGLIRGPTSMGGLLATGGYRTVPSPADPDPGGAPYYTGGYDTRRHGSRDGGSVSGIQVEMNYTGVRDTDVNRTAFASALVLALESYLLLHFGIDWTIP